MQLNKFKGGFELFNLPTINTVCNTNSKSILDTAKEKVQRISDTITNGVTSLLSDVASEVGLLTVIATNNLSFNAQIQKAFERIANVQLTEQDYQLLVGGLIAGKYNSTMSIHTIVESIQRQQTEEVIGTHCLNACRQLEMPLSKMFSKFEINECRQIIEKNYPSTFFEICNNFRETLYQELGDYIPHPNSATPAIPSDKYLDIVRRYILMSDEVFLRYIKNLGKSINSYNSICSVIDKASDLINNQVEKIGYSLNINLPNIIDIPIETLIYILLWGVMIVELITAAYGDINVQNKQIIFASLNVFVALLIITLAREGLPPIVDGGITKVIQKAQISLYSYFYDIIKPIADWGISLANKAIEYSNARGDEPRLKFIITTGESWNQQLGHHINQGYQLSSDYPPMKIALNMLHTFRVADAFLNSIKRGRNIFDGCFQDLLVKLSPLPQNEEASKLIHLFWNDIYQQDVAILPSNSSYGIYFNYDKEIDLIYLDNEKLLMNNYDSFLSVACNIYFQIRDLNKRIGKGDPNSFDDFLVYCIAGRLKDRHYSICLNGISTPQFASAIALRIRQSLSLA